MCVGEYEFIHINTVPNGPKQGIGFPGFADCCKQPDMSSENWILQEHDIFSTTEWSFQLQEKSFKNA